MLSLEIVSNFCIYHRVESLKLVSSVLSSCVISDLRQPHSNTKIIKYANDANVLHFIRDAGEDRFQDEFMNVCEWSNDVGLHSAVEFILVFYHQLCHF